MLELHDEIDEGGRTSEVRGQRVQRCGRQRIWLEDRGQICQHGLWVGRDEALGLQACGVVRGTAKFSAHAFFGVLVLREGTYASLLAPR